MDVVNNFPLFMNDIEASLSKKLIQNTAEDQSKYALDQLFADMIDNAPNGQQEPIDSFGTIGNKPSERIWGKDLMAYFIDSVGGVTKVTSYTERRLVSTMSTIGIDHPSYDKYDYGIIEFLEFGTIGHEIYSDDGHLLKFWSGPPLRWQSTDDPGMVFAPGVLHPGARPYPFVRRSVEDSQYQLDMMIDNTIVLSTFSVLRSSKFLHHVGVR